LSKFNINSGIYSIRCLINNKRYIGSCSNFKSRKNEHFRRLRNNISKNNLLQTDFNLYGEENFIFEILKHLPSKTDEDLIALAKYENLYIDEYKTHINSYGDDFGYNVRKANQISNKTKSKMSEVKKEQSHISGKNNPFYGKGEEISKRQMGKDNPMYGKPAPNRRLTLEQYSHIKKLISENIHLPKCTLYEIISQETKVNSNTIRRIYNNKHWSCKEYER
jgi:group I intron endonuclease